MMEEEKRKELEEKIKREMKSKPGTVVAFLILAAITVLSWIFADYLFGEQSIFNQNVAANATVNYLFQKIPAVIHTAQVIAICAFFHWAFRKILQATLSKKQRGITILKLLNNFLKYVVAIIGVLVVLGYWGVDTSTLLAGVGVLSLIIGLGAQSLIADIVAGIFIVFEDEFEVGDIIVVDGWRGTVDEIGIRATRIIDAGGNVKIINNSAISSVINQTQELSVAKVVVPIAYEESIERVEKIVRDNLPLLKKKIPLIIDGPIYKGVSNLGDSGMDLLFIAQCKENDIYDVQRGLNRELKLLFDEYEIDIPFPQIVVNTPNEKKGR